MIDISFILSVANRYRPTYVEILVAREPQRLNLSNLMPTVIHDLRLLNFLHHIFMTIRKVIACPLTWRVNVCLKYFEIEITRTTEANSLRGMLT